MTVVERSASGCPAPTVVHEAHVASLPPADGPEEAR